MRGVNVLNCRIEGVACASTYAQLYITFHDSARRAYVAVAIAAQGFNLATYSQIAESARLKLGDPDGLRSADGPVPGGLPLVALG
jgi:hypothetical protein